MLSSVLVKFILLGLLVNVITPYGTDEAGAPAGDICEVDVPKVVISLVICVLGLFGNMVVIFVILVLKEFQKSVTHLYVLQLAIADSIFLLTLPFKVSEDLNKGWLFPEWMCKAKETILFLNYYASIFFLVIMSIDRYIAVCHTFSDWLQKLRKRTSAFIITICTWTIALLMCIPVMLYSFKIGTEPNCRCSYEFPNPQTSESLCIDEGFDTPELMKDCIEFFRSNSQQYCKPKFGSFILAGKGESIEAYEQYVTGSGSEFNPNSGSGNSTGDDEEIVTGACNYWNHPPGWRSFLIFNFVAMFIVPFFVMVVCYGLIVLRLSETRMRTTSTSSTASFAHQQSTTSSISTKKLRKSSTRSDKDRRRVTIMCASLVVSFVVCWLPFHSIHLAKIHGINSRTDYICYLLPKIGSLLGYLNSALNPYLYSFLGTNFTRRWRSATGTIRKSIRRRRSSSSSGGVFGSGRNTQRKRCKEGSTANTGTIMTKIVRNAPNCSHHNLETRHSIEASQMVGLNTETQQVITTRIPQHSERIGGDSPPPDYEQSLVLGSN